MTVLGVNNGERLPAIDSQPAFENALRRALEMDEPLQGVLCNNLTVTGENLCRLEALQICLERCRFENCDFSKTSFYDARLVDCDFSNCAFPDSYWKRCQWIGCRLNGANFAGASLHDVQARDTRLRYANFARALMENVKLTDCDCADAGFAEVKLRRVIWQRVSLRQADFFRHAAQGHGFICLRYRRHAAIRKRGRAARRARQRGAGDGYRPQAGCNHCVKA